jgi:hypothetical protein
LGPISGRLARLIGRSDGTHSIHMVTTEPNVQAVQHVLEQMKNVGQVVIIP